jgi:hypothetical protein
MADVVITNPKPHQMLKYSHGMKRVSYKTTQDTEVSSAFIVSVEPEGKYMTLRAGRKYYAIQPQNLTEISFYEK